MPRKLGNDTVIVRRAELVQDPRDGSYYRDWDNATETVVERCNVEPFILSEKLEREEDRNREFAKSGRRVFAPPGTDVAYTDHVIYRDEEYTVLGHPGFWTNFRGVVDHVAFIIQRREG